ncbi:MFS transporter [Ferrovibrio sp.]|uniref:MFS transporter n=1 Tax=Ferrovibrio sp. TaxID=1917215 RepID=UPI00351147EB
MLRPLSRPTLAAYAAPALPGAMLLLPLYVHLPALYAGLPGLSLALVGSLLFAARLWDVATDPLAGLLSDRWPTRFGRRRPWLLAGLPLAMLAAWMLFRPGDAAGGWYLLGWTMLLYLGASLIQIPYYAWGAELSGDYDQRTRISGWREAAAVLGTVTAAALPAAFGADTRAGVAALGLVIVLLLPAGVLLAVWRVPDGTAAAPPRPGAAALRGLWRNGPFRRLLLAWLVNGIANGLPAGLVLLYVGHVMAAPDLAGLVLLLYFGAGIAAVPLWLRLARRYGKHRVWCGAMLWNCAVFVFVPLLGAGDAPLFLVISVLTGLCLGADLALPPAMQADVIDLDAARQRQDRAGLFFALWGMATKLALAAAIGIAFPLLDLAGFSPAGGNGPGALFVLAALYAWLPVAGKLVAVALVWRWPITRARQQRLRRLAARRRP